MEKLISAFLAVFCILDGIFDFRAILYFLECCAAVLRALTW